MALDAMSDTFGDAITGFVERCDEVLLLMDRAERRFGERNAAIGVAEQAALAEAGKVIENANRGAFDIISTAHKDAASIIGAAKSTAEAEAQRYAGDRATRLRELIEVDEAIASKRKTIEQLNSELANLRIRLGGSP